MKPLPPFSFAFQPIVDSLTGDAIAYEALVRGPRGQSAGTVFAQIAPEEAYGFDRECRLTALRLAARLGMRAYLHLNCVPGALLDPEHGINSTLNAARECGFPTERIVVELTEGELLRDAAGFAKTMHAYRSMGVKFAIDDFGAGYSGLNLLADFQPEFVKLDMNLCRGIDGHHARQAIVRGIAQVCRDLGIDLVAEGIETLKEYRWFHAQDITLMQGFLFGKGEFERLPEPHLPSAPASALRDV